MTADPPMPVELYRQEDDGGKTLITLETLADGALQLFYHDVGEQARITFGDGDYEAWATIPAAELPRLAVALLAERYRGRSTALSEFRAFCASHAIAVESASWS